MVSTAHRALKALPEYLVLKEFKGRKAHKV
jgi:hypothetical protein